MLKAFKLDDQQIGTLESLINEGMKPEDAAKKWIGDNKDLVDSNPSYAIGLTRI